MNTVHTYLKYICSILIYNLIFANNSYAQISVDKRNIQNPSVVEINVDKQIFNVSGGTRRGENLFHSFIEFNARKEETINFRNNIKEKNIIVRVNGQNKSTLKGNISSSKQSNFLIINPNGILLKDSFNTSNLEKLHLSTASSISFSDGFILDDLNFIKQSNQESNLASLGFTSNSGPIHIIGGGINLPFVYSLYPINTLSETIDGNALNPKRIILSGANIRFDGAVLNNNNTNLEIFSIDRGNLVDKGSRFLFKNGKPDDIVLTNNSLILASGLNPKIHVVSNKFDINKSSLFLLDNIKGRQSEISIDSKYFSLEGAKSKSRLDPSPESQVNSSAANRSGIFVLNQSDKEVADINIKSDKIDVLSGATIINQAGDINIETRDIVVDSVTNDFNTLDSSIQVIPSLIKDAGDLFISSKNLGILNGGIIGSPAGSLRNAGRSFITSDNILIKGFNPITEFPSSIGSVSITGNNSNDIQVKATNLKIQDGATITSFSSGGGNTGKVTIDAKNIAINGFLDKNLPKTGISSFVFPQFSQPSGIDVAQDLLEIPVPIDGTSGNLIINSDMLSIENGSINVSNFGGRQAGNFLINSRTLNVKNSRIFAATAGGNGGLLDINSDLVILRDSLINANAIKFGEGGGISIDSKALFAIGTNEISANAQFNNGGNVNLNSEILEISEDTTLTSNSQLDDSFNGKISITQRENELRLIESIPKTTGTPIAVKSTCDADSSKIFIDKHGMGTDAVELTEKQQKALYLKQRIDYASQFYYIDSETGKKTPYKPLLAIEEKEDGNLKLVFSPEQSKGLQNLLSSLDNNCFEKS